MSGARLSSSGSETKAERGEQGESRSRKAQGRKQRSKSRRQGAEGKEQGERWGRVRLKGRGREYAALGIPAFDREFPHTALRTPLSALCSPLIFRPTAP